MAISNITFTNNNKRVTIGVTTIEDNLTNAITSVITTPTTSSTNAQVTRVTNLLKITQRFNITGTISTGLNNSAGSPVERTNAADVKADLKEMFKRRVVTVMVYNGNSFDITMESLKITEQAGSGEEAEDGQVRYTVNMTCVEGSLTV